MLPPERVASLKVGARRCEGPCHHIFGKLRTLEAAPDGQDRRGCQLHGSQWPNDLPPSACQALAAFGQYGITLDEELRILKVEGKDRKLHHEVMRASQSKSL